MARCAVAVGTRTADSIELSWTNPEGADLAAVIVRRTVGTNPPTTHTAGTPVSLTSAKATSVTDTGLAADTQYSYGVFTRDTAGNVGTRTAVTSSTLPAPDTTPPGPVTELTVDDNHRDLDQAVLVPTPWTPTSPSL